MFFLLKINLLLRISFSIFINPFIILFPFLNFDSFFHIDIGIVALVVFPYLFIVIIILVAGIVNVNIINNHNPIWIISLVYFINVTKDLSSQKQLVSKNK